MNIVCRSCCGLLRDVNVLKFLLTLQFCDVGPDISLRDWHFLNNTLKETRTQLRYFFVDNEQKTSLKPRPDQLVYSQISKKHNLFGLAVIKIFSFRKTERWKYFFIFFS